MVRQNDLKPTIEYVPPPQKSLRSYAKAVCEALARQRDDPTLASNEVISGLANFLEVITRIQAKHLSKGDEALDDATE